MPVAQVTECGEENGRPARLAQSQPVCVKCPGERCARRPETEKNGREGVRQEREASEKEVSLEREGGREGPRPESSACPPACLPSQERCEEECLPKITITCSHFPAWKLPCQNVFSHFSVTANTQSIEVTAQPRSMVDAHLQISSREREREASLLHPPPPVF